MQRWVQVPCGKARVSDGIGDHYKVNTIHRYKLNGYRVEREEDELIDCKAINKWEPSQPVLISAQTGRGKNYFIENKLLPYIRELNHEKGTRQKVLILSNRIALSLQMKDRLKQGVRYQDDLDDSKQYSYAEYNNVLGAEYADVMSYQSFLSNAASLADKQGKHKKTAPKHLFVILDEAHFFTSDSLFNPHTSKILRHITAIFNETIRVYMTATPYECLDYIMDYENKYALESTIGAFYHFQRDYSYLDIKYYSDFSELKDIIGNSGNDNWLIFRDNIQKGKELKEELETDMDSLNGRVYAVSAESKTDENYQKMVVEERIDVVLKNKSNSDEKGKKVRVLVATSVIDNGVNFRNIQHVVVSDMSRVKVLQMLGRARVEKGQRVTLYIKRHNEHEVQRRIESLCARQNAYHDFKTSKDGKDAWFVDKYLLGDQQDSDKPRHWLATEVDNRNNPKLYINEIADSLIGAMVPTYEAILTEMQSSGSSRLPGQKYLEYQLSWFGHKYKRTNDISLVDKEATKKKFIEFLDEHADGRKMFKDEQPLFRLEFTRLHDATFGRHGPNSERNKYGLDVIKKVLGKHDITFDIQSISDKQNGTYWLIVKR